MVRHVRTALLFGGFAVPLLIANGGLSWRSEPATAAEPSSPAVIDAPFAPKAMRPLSVEEAEKWNSQVPQTAAAVAPAAPFALGAENGTSLARSMQCLTAAIYYEAGNEPVEGQRAVAQVILNRMRSPAYPHSVCGVVYQGSERKTGCQFTFTCDGSLARVPSAAGWSRASAVAAAALGGYVHTPVGWATHYHADYVVPYWAQTLDKLTTIGRHIFYRWNGRAGTGAAFTSRYAGSEPDVAGRQVLTAVAASPTMVAGDGGIAHVTSAERPLIDFAAGGASADAAAAAAKEKVKGAGTVAAEAAHPIVSDGSRWIIGGAGSPGARPGRTLGNLPQASTAGE